MRDLNQVIGKHEVELLGHELPMEVVERQMIEIRGFADQLDIHYKNLMGIGQRP
jgi:hypothetical protein